jgi:hypothetical protein
LRGGIVFIKRNIDDEDRSAFEFGERGLILFLTTKSPSEFGCGETVDDVL